ncbi:MULTISPECIES: DUF4157 domain-containing protein [Chryseobacterium]|uniref:eCIS core domain-containing protein n=1 Tax=Chryseobacterium TaxID=59732 RepID=UPI00195A87B5|nr:MULTISPECIES: DUF4157 domain-containing protein [Chryseobacterium]MBM7419143.1 hypothetical protein [Chryseobacterium sp. JUb44]MDH6209066.1 hypothetical protein [Chryseobacterium sp. BIGb0186]WSO11918.1 DUF4157 domain-containing protein [Chryseobacterium scophthalmum]
MKKLFLTLLIVSAFTLNSNAQSLVSQLIGVDVDVNRGTVNINPPNLNVIPQIIKNAPKDIGQALINPMAPVLASSIRFSRGQALNRGTQQIPQNIKNILSPYFPPNILNNTTWTTANGLSIDGALNNWFNQEGAITYDDVIVFSDQQLTNNIELWAHELTHVLQYSQMGVETFAFQYSINWNSLESQARDNASRIMSNLNSIQQGNNPKWTYNIAPNVGENPITWNQINNAAKLAIPASDCIWVNNQNNTTGNKCPCSVMVTGVIMKRISDGFVTTMPCNESTCLFQAGQYGPLLSPPGFVITGVTAAHQY